MTQTLLDVYKVLFESLLAARAAGLVTPEEDSRLAEVRVHIWDLLKESERVKLEVWIEQTKLAASARALRETTDHATVVEWHGLLLRWNEPAKCFDNFEQNQAPSTAWAWATVCPHGRLWTASIHFRKIDSGSCSGETPELALTAAAYELDGALSELRKHVRNEPEEK